MDYILGVTAYYPITLVIIRPGDLGYHEDPARPGCVVPKNFIALRSDKHLPLDEAVLCPPEFACSGYDYAIRDHKNLYLFDRVHGGVAAALVLPIGSVEPDEPDFLFD